VAIGVPVGSSARMSCCVLEDSLSEAGYDLSAAAGEDILALNDERSSFEALPAANVAEARGILAALDFAVGKGKLEARSRTQLLENIVDMHLGSAVTDYETMSDLGICATLD
jgi:hypothetical protein